MQQGATQTVNSYSNEVLFWGERGRWETEEAKYVCRTCIMLNADGCYEDTKQRRFTILNWLKEGREQGMLLSGRRKFQEQGGMYLAC